MAYKLKQEAKRYHKFYPSELVHFDTKRLPLLKGEDRTNPRGYLFVAIDDYSTILTDKPLTVPLYSYNNSLKNTLIPLTMLILIMVKSIRVLLDMLLLNDVKIITLVKSLLGLIDHKPMVKRKELLER